MKTTSAVGIVAAVGVIGTVGACGFAGRPRAHDRAYEVAGVTSLRMRTSGHQVELVAGDRPGVRVVETVRYNKRAPGSTHSLRNGALEIRASGCGTGTGLGFRVCELRYRVEVPRALAISIDSAGGDITAHGLSGPLNLTTSGGQVRADALAAKNIAARTDGGSMHLTLAAVPDLLDLRTTGGGVEVRLPGGDYAVDARSGGGRHSIGVHTASGSPHRIMVRSSGGDVVLAPG